MAEGLRLNDLFDNEPMRSEARWIPPENIDPGRTHAERNLYRNALRQLVLRLLNHPGESHELELIWARAVYEGRVDPFTYEIIGGPQ